MLFPELLPIVVFFGSYIIYRVRGFQSMFSYLFGLIIIAVIIFFSSIIYNVQLYNLLGYLYIYSLIIPVAITITLAEILLFIRIDKLRFILYLLVVLRIYSLLLERFWRTIEFYQVYYNGKFLIYRYSLRSLLGSLPYIIRSIAEYLYVNIKR
ncbi:hypothetical protein Shell_0774 [Staphylothermus hellenicus DSM 12710]|uniref:Uncharacterized protein n=2 Tax=Staphylothermus hellenicus TaxID=84599 RepID=D7D7Z4_STAHD|nr:hypothetical protein Shell_0774 [Staphylothermus hellenicus DSM 12710]